MRILIVCNLQSGRGRAAVVASAFEAALRQAGHGARTLTVATDHRTDVGAALRDSRAEVLAIIGGDGTVHGALDAAIGARVAIYHVPLGTENLFARQFGMDRSPVTLVRALEWGSVQAVDVGECNGEVFALMCGVGPDAGVIHRVSRARLGSISHLSYVRPIVAEIIRPRLARLTITVDGERVAEGRRGLAVVANSRCYAMRLDPARGASMTDGVLDVVFFPARSGLGVLGWAGAARLGLHGRRRTLTYRTGRAVRIESDGAVPCQLDGEAVGHGMPLTIRVRAGALRVLLAGP